MEYNFKLSKVEIDNYEKWLNKLPKKYKDEPTEFIFTIGVAGIGIGVTAKKGKITKDITDFDLW